MNKQDSMIFLSLIFVLGLSIFCDLPQYSTDCICGEVKKKNNGDSLPENIRNYSQLSDSVNFDFTMTSSSAALASVSPSAEFLESKIS